MTTGTARRDRPGAPRYLAPGAALKRLNSPDQLDQRIRLIPPGVREKLDFQKVHAQFTSFSGLKESNRSSL